MKIEQFVNDFLEEHTHDVLLAPYNALIEFSKQFKEELKKEALDAEVDPYKENWTSFLVNVPSENFKDKAKIIVINED